MRAGAAPRAAAARAVHAVRFDGTSLKAALPAAAGGIADPRDRALCDAIAFTACRWLPRYEFVLGRLLERPLPRRDAIVHALLLAGLAQLDALQLPAYAALDATAEAARTLDRPRLVGLVNAVLRRFLRERDALQAAIDADPVARSAHPRWLLDALRAAWPDDADAIVAANNSEAPLWLRINRRRIDPAAYRQQLDAAGIAAAAHPELPSAVRIDAGGAPTALPGWDAGLISVQDGAAQLCAAALDARPGERILDACAAPGGKAAALLEAVDGIDLVALDVDSRRMQRIDAGLQRLGLRADVRAADATQPATWWDGRPFDRILLDAPCSATGVIRRQPDIKFHRRAADIDTLAAQQAALLDGVWPLLRAGGRLVYATCSVLPAENALQIDAFLSRHADARAVPLDARHGRVSGAGRQRLPGDDGMDGFFYAAIEKLPDARSTP